MLGAIPDTHICLVAQTTPVLNWAVMKKRVFSGARPTGRQHIGNYLGAIRNYVKLQDDYDCVYCAVDVHALTSLEDTSRLAANCQELVLDWLAAGMDPAKSIIFVQSHVPEVMELHAYLSMVTPMGWLLRVPTFKEKVKLQPDNVNYGLLGYPVLMASDIMLYKGDVVPVAEDQLPHLELTREIVRRFNARFGNVFPEPEGATLPLIPGLDGNAKMSKQAGNTIELALDEKDTAARIMTAVTDPARRFRKDPGHPDICNVYFMHGYFTAGEVAEIGQKCRAAGIGCVECKRLLAENMNAALRTLRARRAELAARPEHIRQILGDGALRARAVARETMREVREKMRLVPDGSS